MEKESRGRSALSASRYDSPGNSGGNKTNHEQWGLNTRMHMSSSVPEERQMGKLLDICVCGDVP